VSDNGGGLVLGTSTVPTGAALGVSAKDCNAYLTGYIRYGKPNDSEQVLRLQRFLRDLAGFSTVTETGTYDASSYAAVHAFQNTHKNEILTPWGIKKSTGYVYYTTRKKINETYCKFTKEFTLSADQHEEIERIKTGGEVKQQALPASSVTLPSTTPSTTPAPSAKTAPTQKADEIGSLFPKSQTVAVGASMQSKGGSWLTKLLARAFGR
jgi:hypothetical protein